MNSPEAQFILSACRPGRADAEDARVSEALALAQDDPELAAWWEDQQAFDAALVGKLKDVPPPPELALQLRAGRNCFIQCWRADAGESGGRVQAPGWRTFSSAARLPSQRAT